MKSLFQFIVNYFRKVNWMLLLFLVLVLNVKMVVKIAAIILLLVLNRKILPGKSIYRQKFIWFYLSMIVVGILNLLLNRSSISVNYDLVAVTGIFFWLLCAATAFLNSWFIKKNDTEKLHITITFFFILNIIVTFGQLILIMLDAGSINPFTYQGMHQKYFMGTGDKLTGLSFDTSTTNALINAFGVIYLLKRSSLFPALLCMATMLLTASNFTNLLLIVALYFMFIFQSSAAQKSIIIVCSLMLVIFLAKISPQNAHYINDSFEKIFNIHEAKTVSAVDRMLLTEKPDSLLNKEEKKQKIAILYLDSLYKAGLLVYKSETAEGKSLYIKPIIPKPSIHTPPYQRLKYTTDAQKKLLAYAQGNISSFDTSLQVAKRQKYPGKLIALQQTIHFLRSHPYKLLTGEGMGNFSSKLAFRVTGFGVAGGYPSKFVYINNDFKNNHLELYLYYFSKDMELHSLLNAPDSVYDQLLSEYGLVGIFLFLFLYVSYFIKQIRKLTYGIPLMIILAGALATGYWFEQLSIVILFELLLLLDTKSNDPSLLRREERLL